ncbi:MAG: hypothetical protein ACTSVY_03675 [Candidatus Helarchaeota archaeon]
MSLNIFEFSNNLDVNRGIKIGILALFMNVIVNIIKFSLGLANIFLVNYAIMGILLGLETVTLALMLSFAITIYLTSKLFQNQTALIASITFALVNIISYMNLYFYPYLFMSILIFIDVPLFILMLATIIFFILKMSEKIEEKIMLYTVGIWIIVTIVNWIISYMFAVLIPLTLAVRDFFTAWSFGIIITDYETSGKKQAKSDKDYKHVKVRYESDE